MDLGGWANAKIQLYQNTVMLNLKLKGRRYTITWTDPESFIKGYNFDNFFWLMGGGGGEDPNTTISGLSSGRQRNAI